MDTRFVSMISYENWQIIILKFDPQCEIVYRITCAPSKDLAQPVCPRSLIRVSSALDL